ncbi:MAG: PocR ligand-binding domain-containing protein [Propionibacteriaceae bacterium]|jgi:ligand-binding sensor protein/AraC-like DNA-binding protein|nr:PocR ligand-binding domain-containing protein [Propionibacteriaceae bacterium]
MAELHVSSLIDLDHLQRVQQRFAEATDLGVIAVNSRGTPVTAACRFSEFCQRMRADPVRRQLCYGCDAHGGLQAAIRRRPHIYQCHAGLVDFSIPITAGDLYVGAVLCGQVRIERRSDSLDHVMAVDDSWQRDPELRDLHDQTRLTSARQVEAAAETLWDVLTELDPDSRRSTTIAVNPEWTGLEVPTEPARRPLTADPAVGPLSQEPVAPGVFWKECEAEDMPAAFTGLSRILDQIWELAAPNRVAEVERVEDAVADVARALCPDIVKHLRYQTLKQRARRAASLNRYQVQTMVESMLVLVFDGVRRLRPKRHRDFQDLLNEIERRRAKAYSLTEAAAFLNISPGHLSKKFKAVTGTSFMSYVMARRMRRAHLMLAHTDLPVVKVAAELGFHQANYFARVFKAETGLSPSEFRRESSLNPDWSRNAPVSCRN